MTVQLRFGTGGVPLSTGSPTTGSGIERAAELGLDCMEVQFVRGVHMGEETAQRVAEVAKRNGVRLSAHAPYFINLNSHDKERLHASKMRLVQTARIASLCGADAVVFHPAYYLDDSPPAVYRNVMNALKETVARIRDGGIDVVLRPETTGKPSHFGTLEETLRLCAEVDGLAPCIDFAHLHAREGAVNTYDEFAAVLQQVKATLGREALGDMHLHVAGVQYGERGEIRHLDLVNSDLCYGELVAALRDAGMGGRVICESPCLEDDALLLQSAYRSL